MTLPVSLANLLTLQTQPQLMTTQLALLALAGMPTTSWQSGNVPLSLTYADTQVLADMQQEIANIAAGGLIDLATGPFLDLIATSHYQLTRKPSVLTQGTLVLTDVGGGGPFTIVPYQLTAQPIAGVYTYQNIGGGTLPKFGTLPLTWAATTPGAAYNLAIGAINSLATPLPGVTVNNPDNGTGTWITQLGADAESDASLALRCKQEWSLLSGSATSNTYSFWAVTSTPTVTRANPVPNTPSGGQVTVYIAGSTGGSPPADVASVSAYITPRVPLGITANIVAATNVVIALAGTISVTAANLLTAQSTFAANLNAFSQGLQIGSTVYLSQLIDLFQKIPGVRNLSLSSPASDTALANNQVAVFSTGGLTWVGV